MTKLRPFSITCSRLCWRSDWEPFLAAVCWCTSLPGTFTRPLKIGGWRQRPRRRRFSLSAERAGSGRSCRTRRRFLPHARQPSSGAAASAGRRAAGYHWQNGQFDLARLRHPLTAVLANAEFLADAELTPVQREELYQEIRVAVNRLTDLIDSLLEFRGRPTR